MNDIDELIKELNFIIGELTVLLPKSVMVEVNDKLNRTIDILKEFEREKDDVDFFGKKIGSESWKL